MTQYCVFVLGVAFSLVMLAGCGSSESRKYQYSENKCDTGEHSFDSVQAYCAGLKDFKLNKGCAAALRKEAFERDCSGQTWQET